MNRHQMYWVALWAGATGAGLILGNYIHESQSTKPIPPLTPQDVMLALEAHEAKHKPCKCQEDNDDFISQVKAMRTDLEAAASRNAKVQEAGIPNLPGVTR